MKELTRRDIIQKEIVEKAVKNKKGILYIAPRTGKTYIALMILLELGIVTNILVAFPNIPIKNSWEEEIGKRNITIDTTYTTFASLHKHENLNYDAIIIDECHALSEGNIESLKTITWNIARYGLTGTLSSETQNTLLQELGMDICYEYPIEQAVKEGVISDYSIEVHMVPLDNKIVKEYTKKKTKRTEKQHFDHLSRTIEWMEGNDISTFHKRLERMRLIQNSEAKLEKTRNLLNGRSLVFCGTTATADKVGCASYHSKSNEKEILDNFCKGQIDQLAVCKMLNMGITISNLNSVILNYTDSNEENLVQKICRCLNYDYKDKTAIIKIVSSTEEVELKWVKKALKSLDPSKILWINS